MTQAVTLADAGVQGSAKAWVSYKGTATRAINASYNVSSVTYNGAGDYTVNFTNAFVDANYSAPVSTTVDTTSPNYSYTAHTSTKLTTSCRVRTGYPTANSQDCPVVDLAFFR